MHAHGGSMIGRKTMDRLLRALTAVVSAWFLGSGVLCVPAVARDFKLVLDPQKAPAEVGKFSLLPPEGSLIDEDAVRCMRRRSRPFRTRLVTVRSASGWTCPSINCRSIRWRKCCRSHIESLRAVVKAAKCRQCNWPEWKPGMQIGDLSGYRRLAFVVRLWARMEIANEGYEGAILALQTGFGMARHLGQAPTIIQVLVGTAVGAVMSRQVAEFVEGEGAPNLYPALASLPKPFVQMEKAIETERKAAGLVGALVGEMDASQDRCRVIAKRFDRVWRPCSASKRFVPTRPRTVGSCPRPWPRLPRFLCPRTRCTMDRSSTR